MNMCIGPQSRTGQGSGTLAEVPIKVLEGRQCSFTGQQVKVCGRHGARIVALV